LQIQVLSVGEAEMTAGRKKAIQKSDIVEPRILTIRGQKVILDADLARIYGVPTFRFNEAVKRNRKRFPPDFMFQLKYQEVRSLTSQIAMSNSRGGRRTLPYVFTEHGAVMAANILKSDYAVRMSVLVVRAFVRMRQILASGKELSASLAELEKSLTERLDGHEYAIFQILDRIMRLIDPPIKEELPPKRIGFLTRERRASYGLKMRRQKS
jgi:hypothetical protein